jgi:AGCS family alanine or glycine:cation symporter
MKLLNTAALAGLAAFSAAPAAIAQEAQTIDQKVNEVFATLTGPFVSLIFAPFPGTSFPGS